MTSALQRLHAEEDDTIWRQNVSVIRQLYQEEKKTLKQVKSIMENEKEFPVTPLSIWEMKLRKLGMQKKLKAKDWPLVYQYIRPRLEHEGKNKLRKPTAILINGTKKPWSHVWKEFRRTRALSSGPRRGLCKDSPKTLSHRRLKQAGTGPLPPLPAGVVIRTPSPELLETTFWKHQSDSPHFLVLQLFQTTIVSLQPLFDLKLNTNTETSDGLKDPGSVYRLCLEGIPFTVLLGKISDTVQVALPSSRNVTASSLEESQVERTTLAFCPLDNVAATGQATRWQYPLTGRIDQLLQELNSASPTGQDLRLNFDSHHYLSLVIYLLSNNLVIGKYSPPHEVTMFEILQMTFTFVSRRVLLALLHSGLPSVKIAWEKLLLSAGARANKEAFRVLISVGMDNGWLDELRRGHEYLFSAAQMGLSDILCSLISRGCRSDLYPRWCCRESIIVEALENSGLDCAKLLIQHCDVNHEFRTTVTPHRSTNFVKFILGFDDTNEDHIFCLELFLKQGADVDYEICTCHPMQLTGESWEESTKEWPLSILDYIYYNHRPLFPMLAVYSKASLRFSRARALWYLEQGTDVFRDHLTIDMVSPKAWGQPYGNETNTANVSERKNRCLEVLLAEQFLLSTCSPHRDVCWRTVQSLIELGIDVAWLSKTEFIAAEMLHVTACLTTSGEGPDKDHGLRFLNWLLSCGFEVKANVLLAAIHDHDMAVLKYLASFCQDLEKEGGEALAQAAISSDFDAARLVLDTAMDLNPTIVQENNLLEAAACGSTFAMMKFLVQRGAKPRIRGHEGRSFLFWFLVDIIQHHRDMHVVSLTVQYTIEKHINISEPSFPSANLLEACLSHHGHGIEERRAIFEVLWKKGAKLKPGSPLAQWIATGGGKRLVQEMLDADADPNAHSSEMNISKSVFFNRLGQTPLQAAAGNGDYTLVCMLMERGADLNGPAFGKYSMTALQAICVWDPVRREERLRKDKIIKLFLDEGADVNAANSTGHTALIYAAQLGDLSTAFTLLKHGAKLDAISTFNYDDIGQSHQTALDGAACYGRLDMVEFLLNANALSWTAYSDGKDYDGAIQYARRMGNFVIAELICKHSADRKKWDAPHGQAIDEGIPSEHASLLLSLRGKDGTSSSSWPKSKGPLTPNEDLQNVVAMDQINSSSNVLGHGMVETGGAANKDKGRGTSRAEATGVSCTRVIESPEDEPPLTESRGEMSGEEKSYKIVNKAVDTLKASSGLGRWLYQPREQNWIQAQQQRVDPLVSSNLSTDVFMGFSGFSSP